MTRINPYCNTKMVEDELNIRYVNHNYIKPEDVVVFAVLDDENYYPIKTSIDSNKKFHIEDNPNIIRRPLYAGSKKQFLYKRYDITVDSIRLDLDAAMKTAWNPNRFLLFRNGKLLSPNLYKIYIPTFDSDYAIKCIYSSTSFKAGDKIDVFYIEHPDYQQVRFNQDVYIQTRRAYCESANQVLVKVPYPYDLYPRNKNMFYVFNDQTHEYLDNRYDYTVAEGAEYIVLKDDTMLVKPYKDNLVFTFPYAKEDFEDESDDDGVGEKSGVSFITRFSSYEPIPNVPYSLPDGLIYFDPPFSSYKLTKTNIMLFCNTTFIDPDRYELVSNGCVRLLNQVDIDHYEFSRFTMLIFAETTKTAKRYREFDFKVFQVFPRSDGQTVFNVPTIEPKNTDFMVFEGTLFFDVHDRYVWDTSTQPNTITLNSPAIKLRTNRPLTFLFYTNSDSGYRKTKYLELVKIYFESTTDGKVHMYNSRRYNISFNKKNSIIFMNGVYLEPDRYEIDDDNNLTFNTSPTDIIFANKGFTGIYLVSHKYDNDDGDEGYYMKDEMSQGFKEKYLWFDELYAIPVITDINTGEHTGGGTGTDTPGGGGTGTDTPGGGGTGTDTPGDGGTGTDTPGGGGTGTDTPGGGGTGTDTPGGGGTGTDTPGGGGTGTDTPGGGGTGTDTPGGGGTDITSIIDWENLSPTLQAKINAMDTTITNDSTANSDDIIRNTSAITGDSATITDLDNYLSSSINTLQEKYNAVLARFGAADENSIDVTDGEMGYEAKIAKTLNKTFNTEPLLILSVTHTSAEFNTMCANPGAGRIYRLDTNSAYDYDSSTSSWKRVGKTEALLAHKIYVCNATTMHMFFYNEGTDYSMIR